MKAIRKTIRRPLNTVSLMYWLNLPDDKADEKYKQWRKSNQSSDLVVYETKQNEFLLIEGYEYYFSIWNKNPNVIITFTIGNYDSDLDARYAAVKELISYQSAWVTKMQQIRILYHTYKQEKKILSTKLGIPLRKVDNYLIDEKVPLKIRAKAAECDQARLANAICRADMSDRFKQIMYEFVTYPPEHNLRLTDNSWKLARSMILENWKELLNLSDRNIRFLIVRHAIEFQKRSLENFTAEIEELKIKTPVKAHGKKFFIEPKRKTKRFALSFL